MTEIVRRLSREQFFCLVHPMDILGTLLFPEPYHVA